jgi:acetylornithine deacetylase/succinyl-diaminopimelate desuccinylase-like protein
VFCLLKAYEAVLGEDGRPPLNVHFIFEGEEECGGRVIYDLLRAEPERTRADAVLVSDSSFFAPGLPAVYTALRGICYAEISVRTLQRDLHSGTYGGVAPNALETLVRILSRLKSADGEIRIPKLYKAVRKPSKKELKAWRKLPFDEETFLRDEVTAQALTGLEDYSVLERTWALPTLEIHGIRGGFVAEGAKTVIPATATAKVSLRLVPGQRLEKVARQLERAVARLAPSWAEVRVTQLHGGDPVEIPVDHPAFGVLDDAFEEIVGRRTVPVRSGGSIPIVPELALR